MQFLPGYWLRLGLRQEQATLVKFLQLSYQELFPQQNDFSHLAETVRQYFSQATPLWWVEFQETGQLVACLWLGNSIDQVKGDRYAHIFLLYVMPEHRRQGIAKCLMQQAQEWAKARGDRQIALQVFPTNQPALNLYQQLGYQTQSLWMVKPLVLEE